MTQLAAPVGAAFAKQVQTKRLVILARDSASWMSLAFPAWVLKGKRRPSHKVKDETDDDLRDGDTRDCG
jgi:hypothetical protein